MILSRLLPCPKALAIMELLVGVYKDSSGSTRTGLGKSAPDDNMEVLDPTGWGLSILFGIPRDSERSYRAQKSLGDPLGIPRDTESLIAFSFLGSPRMLIHPFWNPLASLGLLSMTFWKRFAVLGSTSHAGALMKPLSVAGLEPTKLQFLQECNVRKPGSCRLSPDEP